MPAVSRQQVARYAAPAAFLLAVTIAVLLVRAGLGGGGGQPATTAQAPATRPSTRTATVPSAPATTALTTSTGSTTTAAGTYTVQRGDTFGAIAAKEGTTVAALEELNPGVSSTALRVGQQIRVK